MAAVVLLVGGAALPGYAGTPQWSSVGPAPMPSQVNSVITVDAVYAGTHGGGVWAWNGTWSQLGGLNGLPGDADTVYSLLDVEGEHLFGTP